MQRDTAKVFVTGRSQAVRLPKAFRFNCDEVYIRREGNKVILTPKPEDWRQYFASGKRFSDDYPDQIEDTPPEERESF